MRAKPRVFNRPSLVDVVVEGVGNARVNWMYCRVNLVVPGTIGLENLTVRTMRTVTIRSILVVWLGLGANREPEIPPRPRRPLPNGPCATSLKAFGRGYKRIMERMCRSCYTRYIFFFGFLTLEKINNPLVSCMAFRNVVVGM
jgi:hypothetical protein